MSKTIITIIFSSYFYFITCIPFSKELQDIHNVNMNITENKKTNFENIKINNFTSVNNTAINEKATVNNTENISTNDNVRTPIVGNDTVKNESDITFKSNETCITEKFKSKTRFTINDEDNVTESETTIKENIEDKITNDTFKEKVKNLFKRLFKREIVGSLVRRDTNERETERHIKVPLEFQHEYYDLRQRKEEIERMKNIWANDPNKKEKYADLIDLTWEKLVNWSIDHLAFEDKIIRIHNIRQNDAIQGVFDKDSDDSEKSENEIKQHKSDETDESEKTEKSSKEEYVTVRNIDEVNDKYMIEKNIESLEEKMKRDPNENNEKNKIILEDLNRELLAIHEKYERIRDMKIQRTELENIWKQYNVFGAKRKRVGGIIDEDMKK